jgi:murein DD-endopeptidase MepM/ murein hydrolase activator NlpD
VEEPGRRRRFEPGLILWLALPAAALWAASSSPAIAQRSPRFLFPALAVAGAALLVASLMSSLVQLVRRYRDDGRLRLFPVVANVAVTVLLVVLPFSRAVGLLAPSGGGVPRVLAGFGDWRGAEGYPRLSPHRGVDVAGRIGADVLAAADGRVTAARDTRDLCGLIVAIVHDPHGYRTVYCHLSAIVVKAQDEVKRGQPIGTIGTTGQRAWPGYEHVHWELQRGDDKRDIEDPVARTVGCFDGTKAYPADRLVVAYPVKC